MKPLVSVVMLAWNRRKEVRKSLSEIRNQEWKKLEIIVVDNHSTDGTPEMIRSEFPEVNLIKMPENVGIMGSNIGIGNCMGKYVLILDDDSYPGKETIRRAVESFRRNPEDVGVICTRVINPHTGGIDTDIWKQLSISGDDVTGYEGNFFHGAGCFVRKEVFERSGYYDKDYFIYGNEGDLALRILDAGYRMKYMPNLVVYHQAKEFSGRGSRSTFYRTRNYLATIWKHYPFWGGLRLSCRWLAASFVCAARDLAFLSWFLALVSFLYHLGNTLGKRKVVSNHVLLVNQPIVMAQMPPLTKYAAVMLSRLAGLVGFRREKKTSSARTLL